MDGNALAGLVKKAVLTDLDKKADEFSKLYKLGGMSKMEVVACFLHWVYEKELKGMVHGES